MTHKLLEEIMILTSERAALDVMKRHIEALNALDENSLAQTLHFPHYRLVGSKLDVWSEKEIYLADFRKRAGEKWAQSKWESIDVQESSSDKVHLLVQVVRFDNNDNVIAKFKSLWVITLQEQKWAAQFRSSFAAA